METFGLSPLQKGMYYHHLLAPSSGVDIEQVVIDLPEEIAVGPLESAWNVSIARHQILRAGFGHAAGVAEGAGATGPVHKVHDTAAISIQCADWHGGDIESLTRDFLRQDRGRPFDLCQPPLMRLLLARIGPQSYRLFWTFHHIIIDGPSLVVLLGGVFRDYELLRFGSRPECTPAPGYRAYVEWTETLDSAGSEDYWRAQLAGFMAPASLPNDPVEPRELGDTAFGEEEIRLPADETARLFSFAKSQQVTLNTLLQGGWALLLSRHSGERDVVVGATKTTRSGSAPNRDSAVGLYLATLPLRVACHSEMPIAEFLARIRTCWLSMRPYEHVSLTDIMGWSNARGTGLFDSLVLYHNLRYEEELRKLGGAWASRGLRIHEQTNSALSLVGFGGAELSLKLEFDHRRYTRSAAARYLAQLRHVLSQFREEDAQRPLSEIEVVSPDERRRILDDWNNTAVDYERSLRVHDLYLRQVAAGPDSVAVCAPEGALTYSELNIRANAIAAELQRRSIGRGAVVGISLDRSANMVAALLAVMKCGAAYVPVDPMFPPDRILYMMENSGAAAVITSQPHAAMFEGTQICIVDVEHVTNAGARGGDVEGGASADDIAYILYTSGSTGRPKGVEIPHRALVNFLLSMARILGTGARDTLLSVTTLSFDISGLEIFLPLITGGQVVLVASEVAADGRELLRAIQARKPSILQATPATWRMLLAAGWERDREMTALCGGEALSAELADQIQQRATLWNMYGPTETTIWSTCARLAAGDPVTIGRPIDNTTIYIVDDRMRPVPIGATGELLIGGEGVGLGYRGLPELSADKFIQSPFRAFERLYRTGDLARYRNDGRVEFLGRFDQQVKIRGFRIELGEIETSLNGLPEVGQAIVTVHKDAAGELLLVAYVVPAVPGVAGDLPATLRGRLREKLPAYMIPTIFVEMPQLPPTPNGKVDRKALPVPLASTPSGPGAVDVPMSGDERRMAAIWEKLLGLQRVRVDDRFLDVGGHSLLAVELLIGIEDVFGVSLPLVDIRNNPTVGELVSLLATRGTPS